MTVPYRGVMATAPFLGVTTTEVAADIKAGTVDPVRLVEQVLDAVVASQADLNAFVTVCADEARRDAVRVKDEIAGGTYRGPLHGVPVAVKDIVDTAGILTTMGSRHFRSNVPARDADVVTRLKDAGAVVVGKTTTHEFAFGPTGDRTANGPCANPHDPTRMAGGSSAGSAAAVGAGLVPLAIGTDTGGSVRIPAALCGVVGIRPTMGVISTDGVFPLSWTLDSVGVLANDVAGAETGWRVLAGSGDRLSSPELSDIRVGLVEEAWFERRDDTVRSRFDQFVRTLRPRVARIEPVAVPDAEELRSLYGTVQSVEVLAIHSERMRTAPDLFDPEVLQRLRAAPDVSAPAYAQSLRDVATLRASAAARLGHVDIVILPTVPVVAPPLGIRDADIGGGWTSPRDALLAHTALWGVLGLPAISIPLPDSDGLPVGAQLVGAPGADLRLLAIAAAIERLLTDRPL
jgi:Asp-tRNA(Asn)/Glu-tRNA(Gln) amidotransferase A subunit family amidase